MRTTRLAATVAGLVLSIGSIAVAPGSHAAPSEAAPAACAQEQKQLDRAEDALARVTTVFEHQQAKVKKAKQRVDAAHTAAERARARRALAEARKDRDEAARTKKAQQQRVARAQTRLDTCQAAQLAA
jgi:hypothetical protein